MVALHDSKFASRCSSTLDRRFDQTRLVLFFSRFVIYNVAETISCEQIGQNSNSILSSTRALEWLAMGCPQLHQFHFGAIPLVLNFVRGTRRRQGKGYNYHNLDANSMVKPKNRHTPKSWSEWFRRKTYDSMILVTLQFGVWGTYLLFILVWLRKSPDM